MNLGNAFAVVVVLLSSLTLATGKESLPNGASSDVAPASNPALGPSTASGQGDPADLTIFFTGHLLGYYRLPEWQSADFEATCTSPQPYTSLDVEAESSPNLRDKLPPKTPADAFLSPAHNPNGDILVGMGDNFGVTLESRTWRDRVGPDKRWQLHAKSRSLADWPESAPGDEIGDNVGCFFARAGYDAIVPGKDDFYFGPERLRRIAGRLANVPEKDGMHPVRMLAANLVVKTDFLKKPPEIQDADKDLKFVAGMPTGIKSMDVSDKGTLLPFARQIRFEVSSSSLYSVAAAGATHPSHLFSPFLCQVKNEDGLDRLDPSRCLKRMPMSDPSKEKKSTADKAVWDFNLPTTDWPPKELPALFGLCANIDQADFGSKTQDGVYYDKKRKDTRYYCQRFTVAEPLFGDSNTNPWVIRQLKKKQDRSNREGNKSFYAVIFGVVDKDLTTLVGRDNLAWRNRQPKTGPGAPARNQNPVSIGKETYGTTVDTVDEAASLGVAMRSFDLFWQANHPNEPIFKILLAQMTRGKAETLAANLANTKISDSSLRFDVVISAAADFSAATADEEATFNRPSTLKNAKVSDKPSEFRQFVGVPWLAYDSENLRMPNPLRSLTVTDSGCSLGLEAGAVAEVPLCTKRTFVVGGHYYDQTFPIQETIGKPQLEASYDGMGRTYLSGKNYWRSQVPRPGALANSPSSSAESDSSEKSAPPTLENAFQLAVLAALRDHTHADVAMLQKRDFYWGPFPEPLSGGSELTQPSGELLERILWMGDYLEVLSVKGSTLKKVLDDSDKLDALDEQATQETVEPARGVLAFGIEKTRDKQYLVDGMQLDPNRLYTVATSNHIAAGDNGYPELADPQFADKRLPRADKDDDSEDDNNPRISSLVCKELGGESCVSNHGLLFARIQNPSQLPPQLEPSLSGFLRAYVRSAQGVPELLGDGYNRTNYQAQLNPTWRFSLKDFSFNLNAVRNNLSEVQRITELGGVTEPGAGNAKSHSISFSTHAEWVRSGKWLDEFIRGLSEYQATVTGNTAAVPITGASGTVTSINLYPAPALVTRSKNQFAVDAGFFWHRGHKFFDKLGMVIEPLHFDTQLAPQELQFPAVYSSTGNISVPAINLNLARNRNLLQRIAFRSESDKSHFEVGYQGGWQLNALESLNDNLGSCSALTITVCLETQESEPGFQANSISQVLATRERHGPYADLDWTWPLIWKLGFRTQDSFAYYGPAHLDNSIDTLYRNDATQTVTFQLWPNLNIGPSLERFDYENKIGHVHLRTWAPSIKLTYSFDRLEGGNWRKSLAYSPTSAGGGSQ